MGPRISIELPVSRACSIIEHRLITAFRLEHMYDAICLRLCQETRLYVFLRLLPQGVKPQTFQMEVVENTLHIDIPSSEEGAFSPPETRATAFEVMARVETNCIAARVASSLKIFGAANANNSVQR